MSFSYHSDTRDFEYNGHTLNTLFADRRNFFKPVFYQFIKDILRFNKQAKKFILNNTEEITIKEFVRDKKYHPLFISAYLEPMVASIWSKKIENVLECPAHFILNFFNKHGLLNVYNRPQWYIIKGGSRNYISNLIKNFKNNIYLNTKIEKVVRKNNSVILETKNNQFIFDIVVIATHSDQALQMLDQPTQDESSILGAIPYTENEAILHTDSSLLPKRQLAWASWNYYDIGSDKATLTYYINRLQDIKASKNLLLSINLAHKIAPEKIIHRMSYAHPCFNQPALNAQKKRNDINGKNNTYFCGAYWGFGFHEDGVTSALEVCRLLGMEL
jgi:predicted NAD/FAD-binding protein